MGRPHQAMKRMMYNAKAGFTLPIWHADDRLLLAITRDLPAVSGQPGSSGPLAQGCPLPRAAIKQLISSFEWDEEMGVAHWLLPDSLLQQCGSWHVTLCVLKDGSANSPAELLAVGVPASLSSLSAVAVDVTPWRCIAPAGARSAAWLNMDLIDQAGPVGTASRAKPGCWQYQLGCVSPTGVTIDVLAPGPLPPVSKAGVTGFIDGDQFKVAVRPKDSSSAVAEEEFAVQLPPNMCWVGSRVTEIKLSRSLGLLSARVTMAGS